MAEIELVIKIDEKYLESIHKAVEDDCTAPPYFVVQNLWKSVLNGVQLPKGHGDLVDKSKIHKAIPAEEDNCTGMGMSYDEMDAYNDGIDVMYSIIQDAKPIIEADKE